MPGGVVNHLKLFFFLGFNMLNFLVTDISRLNSLDYFQYIIQFDDQISADIWFIENDFHIEELPFYNQEFECTPFNDNNVSAMTNMLAKNHIEKLSMIEAKDYRVLCFTEHSCQKFMARVIEGCANEGSIEIQEVDKHFIYGFANPT